MAKEMKVVIGGNIAPVSYKPFTQSSETAVRLMLRFPWLMGLYYSMTLFEETSDMVPTAATNSTSMWINPNFWNQLTRDQKMTVIAHEVGHKMYLHSTRRGDRHPLIWNIAGDHRINLDLMESGFVSLADLTIDGEPWSWICDPKYNSPQPWTTEAIYEDVYQQADTECHKRYGKGIKGVQQDIEAAITEWAEKKLGDARDLVDFGNAPDGTKEDSSESGGNGEGAAGTYGPRHDGMQEGAGGSQRRPGRGRDCAAQARNRLGIEEGIACHQARRHRYLYPPGRSVGCNGGGELRIGFRRPHG
jgi:hypothetical protein